MKDRIAHLVLLAIAGTFAVQSCGLQRDIEAADAAANLLRTERLEAEAAAAGWETRLLEETGDLEELLQERELESGVLTAEKAELARQAETLGGEVRVLADMYAELAGSISASEATVFATDSAAAPDSVVAPIDDGLLEGRIAFVPPAQLSLEYRVRLAVSLGVIDTPDGRALLTAMAENPRVALSYGETYYQPPAPIEYCSIGTRAKWGLGGAAVGGGMAVLANAVGAIFGN